jgi:hypothetical protein
MPGLEDRAARIGRLRQIRIVPVVIDDTVLAQPTEEQRYAMTTSIDALALVKTAVEKPKKELSLRQRLIKIQEAFGHERDLMPLARMVIDPDAQSNREIKRYLSRRGIRKAEYAEIKERFDDFYIIADMLVTALPGRQTFAQRREILDNTNGQIFIETGVDAFRTNTHLLVDAIERNVQFLKVNHPMG